MLRIGAAPKPGRNPGGAEHVRVRLVPIEAGRLEFLAGMLVVRAAHGSSALDDTAGDTSLGADLAAAGSQPTATALGDLTIAGVLVVELGMWGHGSRMRWWAMLVHAE